jgi:hypothetical protein
VSPGGAYQVPLESYGAKDDAKPGLADRQPSTTAILRFYSWDHLPPRQRMISAAVEVLALDMISKLPDGPELTTGLRKLLEAKDCFVRAALD